jgi:hypothetical protein
MCGINYPPFVAVCRVADCEEDTWANNKVAPDEDWTQLVAMHDKMNEAGGPPSPYPHRADSQAKIYRDVNDRLWVTHAELLENGYKFVDDETVVFLNEKFYECMAFVEVSGGWWIREIVIDGAAESLEPSMFDSAPEA